MSPRTRFDTDRCYLCGEPLGRVTPNQDHVPPRQFFPSGVRSDLQEPLLTLKTHPNCQKPYGLDEEYVVATIFPYVMESAVGAAAIADFKRRLRRPEGRRLARMVLEEFREPEGGLVLPQNGLLKKLDTERFERVAWKIVRGLHFHHRSAYLPQNTLKAVDVYGPLDESPEFVIALMGEPSMGHTPQVFDFKFRELSEPDLHCWLLRLWERMIVFIAFHGVNCGCETCCQAEGGIT